ncbi:hypothetical protein [Escherichia phage REP7]|uniref:DUF7390 domain-containing protein n=1 Tax=Escherichia phage REP5 TaxID=3022458 RepID=A0AAE9WN69_9CAUD|nr:hypothetical protein [Escherichia phage REP5]WBY53507.1 hypothetical protein [Escherichia phage REP6]WBY53637.1 hypothetical protein [Escherichia phage REP7]
MSKVYNTRKLQIFVLCKFMAKEYNYYYCGTGFISDNDGSYLPFKEAVKLFNGEESSKKDIEKVKLTYSKKDKKIICLDNFVKVTGEAKEFMDESEISFTSILKVAQ